MDTKQRLYDLIDAKSAEYAALSDHVWEYAETRFEEEGSARVLVEALKAAGFEVEEEVGGVPYAFVGTFGSGSPVIGFLGEYDALSGLSQVAGITERQPITPGAGGHGCGHNMLGVGSLAAAAALAQYLAENNLAGTVKYYGCPGEEGGSGKAFMAREGVFADLDAAITWHSSTMNAVASGSSLANIQVYYRFAGRSSHAAASPHLGRSALDAVELMNVGVNYLREHVIPEARVHYAVIDTGGKSPNVVQPNAEVLYLIRAPQNSQVREIYAWVNDIARGAALMTQTEVYIEVDKACSNLVPNEILEKMMQANLEAIPAVTSTPEEDAFAEAIRGTLGEAELAKERQSLTATYGGQEGRKLAELLMGKSLHTGVLPHITYERPMMGSTDVSDVSWIVPTVQCNTSCYALGTPGHSWQMVSQGKGSWAHKGMLLAAKTMAATGLDLINQPDQLVAAKQELRERLGDESYICPIPEGVQPKPVK